jgi:hypothetical protein
MDDFSLSTFSISAAENCKLLKTTTEKLISNAKNNYIEFDPSKTELIHFYRGKTLIEDGLVVANIAIKPAPVVRWLGIWLDSKLNFEAHIEKRLNLATAAYYGLYRLCSTQKGLSFRAARQLYIACITTVADYGA